VQELLCKFLKMPIFDDLWHERRFVQREGGGGLRLEADGGILGAMRRLSQAGRVLGCSALFVLALATGGQAEDFATTVYDGALTIAKYSGTGDAVVIPAAIQGQPVVAIGREAFSAARLKKVVIPDHIVRIEEQAFVYCASLAEVAIGRGVTNIGAGAFRNCTRLESFTVGADNPAYRSVDGILFNKTRTALLQCPARRSGNFIVPPGVTEIGPEAFSRCGILTNIVLPAGVACLGDWAFERCGVVSVQIPDSVTNIGIGVFSSCAGLAKADVGQGLARLGHRMFERCGKLSRVAIPDEVVEIGDWAFYACTNLTRMAIPGAVTRIGHRAFFECAGLAGIEIPGRVAEIGDFAFGGCTGLARAEVGAGVAQIGEGAFADCPALTTLNFKGNAPVAGTDVFLRSDIATVYYRSGASGWDATFGGRPTALGE
jgi:hypothetical protein